MMATRGGHTRIVRTLLDPKHNIPIDVTIVNKVIFIREISCCKPLLSKYMQIVQDDFRAAHMAGTDIMRKILLGYEHGKQVNCCKHNFKFLIIACLLCKCRKFCDEESC